MEILGFYGKFSDFMENSGNLWKFSDFMENSGNLWNHSGQKSAPVSQDCGPNSSCVKSATNSVFYLRIYTKTVFYLRIYTKTVFYLKPVSKTLLSQKDN